MSCGYGDCDTGMPTTTMPTELIDGFPSYSAIEDVELLSSSKEIAEVNESSLAENDKRPRFNIYGADIPYQHLGISGTLSLNFYNNRLQSTIFYPDKADDYLKKIGESGLTFADTDAVSTSSNTIVRKGIDYKGRFYVAWSDRALEKEHDCWIMKYA